MTRFEREKYWVTAVLDVLQFGPCQLHDPKEMYDEETGADVLLKLDDREIGIQVTELDAAADNPFGRKAGQLRADEKRRAAQAAGAGHPNSYGGSVPSTPYLAVSAAIRKKRVKGLDRTKFNEGWLLIVANLNEWGALDSTFVAPSLIDAVSLNIHTSNLLGEIHFDRLFFFMIVGQTLYQWQPATAWQLVDQKNTPGPDDARVRELRKKLFRRQSGQNSVE